jgi:hypothetical protein
MGAAYALGEYERIWGLDTCLFSLCSARHCPTIRELVTK